MQESQKLIALALFVLTYFLVLVLPKRRAHVAIVSAIVYIALGIIPIRSALYAIDLNVLLMIAGTMGLVALFISSRMPALLGDLIIMRTPNVKWAIVSISLFAGIVSAFIDNVATVLMIAPVALTIANKLRISPAPAIIAIAISSNLQGAATLVGDTTSILLGGQMGMDFMDFFVFDGKIGLFFIVQISAIASGLVLLYFFRKENDLISTTKKEKVNDLFPTYMLLINIAALIFASFIPEKPQITNGLISFSLFILALIRQFFFTKEKEQVFAALKEIDLFTLSLLTGLFIVIGAIKEVGLIDDISSLFVSIGGDNIFLIYTLIVFASVLISAFIDNIPYVATMLPVVAGIGEAMGLPVNVLYFGLLVGATLGGNLTPIGASANITALGILRRNGHNVSAKEFMRLSVPFTLTAVLCGYGMVWWLYG